MSQQYYDKNKLFNQTKSCIEVASHMYGSHPIRNKVFSLVTRLRQHEIDVVEFVSAISKIPRGDSEEWMDILNVKMLVDTLAAQQVVLRQTMEKEKEEREKERNI